VKGITCKFSRKDAKPAKDTKDGVISANYASPSYLFVLQKINKKESSGFYFLNILGVLCAPVSWRELFFIFFPWFFHDDFYR